MGTINLTVTKEELDKALELYRRAYPDFYRAFVEAEIDGKLYEGEVINELPQLPANRD